MTTIFDKFNLKGQVAVVTGGAGLLGTEFSRTLAEAGAAVALADMNQEKANKISHQLNNMGLKTIGINVNVTDPNSVHCMVDKIVNEFGRLDILVCSAAMDPKFEPEQVGKHTTAFEDYSLEQWKQALDVNLTGLFLCAQACVAPMLKLEHGVIINICSTYGLVGPDQRLYENPKHPKVFKPVYYSVTKAGVLGLTHYLATYYAGKNIRANVLTPGGIFNDHDEIFVKNYSSREIRGGRG